MWVFVWRSLGGRWVRLPQCSVSVLDDLSSACSHICSQVRGGNFFLGREPHPLLSLLSLTPTQPPSLAFATL